MSFRGIVKKDGKIVAEFDSIVYVPCTRPVRKQDPEGSFFDYERLGLKQLAARISFYEKNNGADEKKSMLEEARKALNEAREKVEKGTLSFSNLPVATRPDQKPAKPVWNGYKANLETVLASVKKEQERQQTMQKVSAGLVNRQDLGKIMPRMQ